MDASDWLPWAWGAGAAVCGAALCLVQPWRRQFRTARRTWREDGWLWMAPALAVLMEIVWQWTLPQDHPTSGLPDAAVAAGDSLAMVLTWITRGDVMSMVLAAAFLANSAGLRRGLWRGIESVFSPGWGRVLRLAVLASATATLGIPAVRFGAGGESGRLAVKCMAALWTSTAATLVMVWLMLSFVSACQVSGKAEKTGRAELAAHHTARLWLPVLAGAVTLPLIDLAGADVRAVLRLYAWPVAALLAWFPLTALQSGEAAEIHTVAGTALRRWGTGFVSFAGWVVVAGTHFFAFHFGTAWLLAVSPEGAWWRAAAAIFTAGAWAWLAVWMLGAWVAIQVDRLPSATRPALPARRKALA